MRSIDKLVRSLRRGQTGCLRKGRYDHSHRQIKISRPFITLRSYPGERATIKGRLWVAADRVKVKGLRLNGRNASHGASPTVTGVGDVFRGNNITNHQFEICFLLGAKGYGRAVRTLIARNRIHDCGERPATNLDHGIYVSRSTDAVIRHNSIYDNADRGIQLYPDATGTRITGNAIDGNGEGISFGGSGNTVARDNVVRGNVIANSRIRWNVESGIDGPTGSGNVVRDNCVFAWHRVDQLYASHGGVQTPSKNFYPIANPISKPTYRDRRDGDLRLRPGSRCSELVEQVPSR